MLNALRAEARGKFPVRATIRWTTFSSLEGSFHNTSVRVRLAATRYDQCPDLDTTPFDWVLEFRNGTHALMPSDPSDNAGYVLGRAKAFMRYSGPDDTR